MRVAVVRYRRFRISNDAEVLGGLAPGESVMVHPNDRIDDAVRVRPRDGRSS